MPVIKVAVGLKAFISRALGRITSHFYLNIYSTANGTYRVQIDGVSEVVGGTQ